MYLLPSEIKLRWYSVKKAHTVWFFCLFVFLGDSMSWSFEPLAVYPATVSPSTTNFKNKTQSGSACCAGSA